MLKDLVIMPFEGTMYPHDDEHVVEQARAMFCQPCQAPTVDDCTCAGPEEEDETDIWDNEDYADFMDHLADSWSDPAESRFYADMAQNSWERAYWGD